MKPVKNQIRGQVWLEVDVQVRDQLEYWEWARVRNQVDVQVSDRVEDQAWLPVWNWLDESSRESSKESVR